MVMTIAAQMGGAVAMTTAGHMGGAIVGGEPELLSWILRLVARFGQFLSS